MRSIVKLTAILAILTPGMAQAATPCITAGEFASLAQFALPSVVTGAKARCGTVLPAAAFLNTGGDAMARRYRQGSAQAWPQAKAAFLKIGNTGKDTDLLLAAMPDASLQATLDGVIQGLVASQLPPNRCDLVDRLLSNLAPLPARNTADLIALLVQTGSEKKGGKAGPINICPA